MVDVIFTRHSRAMVLTTICADRNGRSFLAHYSIDFKSQELKPLPQTTTATTSPNMVDAHMLIPMTTDAKDDGYLVLSRESITYVPKEGNPKSIHISPTSFTSYTPAFSPSEKRFLLGDTNGNLHVLLLHSNGGMYLRHLGTTSIPSCLVYLGDGHVFVGSKFGDSMWVDVNDGVAILDRKVNLGPISDLCVADVGNQDQVSATVLCYILNLFIMILIVLNMCSQSS